MHHKLKLKFTLMCTTLTALVLLAACLFAYSYSKIQIENRYSENFEYQSQILSVFLAGTRQFNFNQFYSMEQESDMYIYFYDNGIPMYFAEYYKEDNNEVFNAFINKLNVEMPNINAFEYNGNQPLSYRYEFVNKKNEQYWGKYVFVPMSGRQWYSFFIIRPAIGIYKEYAQNRMLFTGIFVCGFLLLLLISWVLAKQAVKPVEQAHRQQTEFIAAASHELKSPLAVMLASADYAKYNPDKTEKFLDKIIYESKRMSSLVDDLLLLSGTETGRWKIKKEEIDAENLLLNVYENFLPLAIKKGQDLKLSLPQEDLPFIYADEFRMVQLFSILVSNALAYSPNNNLVEIKAEIMRKGIVVKIIDHGSGIPDEEKQHIFEKFYRSDKARNDKNHFGLGLSVAKELAELQNSSIKVTDTPGGGATFEVAIFI